MSPFSTPILDLTTYLLFHCPPVILEPLQSLIYETYSLETRHWCAPPSHSHPQLPTVEVCRAFDTLARDMHLFGCRDWRPR